MNTLPWLADSLWKATLLLALGLAVLKLRPRRACAAGTHFIALCVCAGVPLVFALSALELPALPRWQPPPVVIAEPVQAMEVAPVSAVSPASPFLPPAERAAGAGDGFVMAWALGVLAALVWHGVQLLKLRRVPCTGAGPDAALADLLEQLMAAGGVKACVALTLDEAIATPMTWGFRRHRLALPLGAQGWDRDRLRSVLAHELMHIQRRDWLSFQLARLCLALVWFHPLAWWLRRELAVYQEAAADDGAVVLTGGNDAQYARHLTDIAASHLDFPRRCAALPMARKGSLGRRVRRLTDATRRRSAAPPRLRWSVMTLTLLAALTLGLMVSCHAPSAAGEREKKTWLANPEIKLLTKGQVDQGAVTMFAKAGGPAGPDIAIEVKFLELSSAEAGIFDIPLHGTAGREGRAGSRVMDGKDFSRLLGKALASSRTKTTNYPRMVTPNNREVVIRSVVNTPVLDEAGKVRYVSVGTVINLLPTYLPGGGFRLQAGLHCSHITGHTEIHGHSYPVIVGQTIHQPMEIPAGSTAMLAMEQPAAVAKDKVLLCMITPSLAEEKVRGVDLRGSSR